MPNDFIKHAFVSPKGDGPDPTLVRPSNWNDGHILSGGINGQVLVYDNTQDNNIRWVEGARIYVSSTSINNPTASPYTNIGTLNINPTSLIVVDAIFDVSATTVGSVTYAAELIVDGSSVVNTTLQPGVLNTVNQVFILNPGSHSLFMRLTSAGNVNFTGGAAGIKLLTLGI